MITIPGLHYAPEYITPAEEAELIAAVDAEPWLEDLRRRVQHYGYRYDYKARRVDASMYLGPLPAWVESVAARLVTTGDMSAVPDQLIVHEYEPGQGISSHRDCVPCFGETICSVSLGSTCVMLFEDSENRESLVLERRSLLALRGDARYLWKHSIPARRNDRDEHGLRPRGRRLSLTFRTIVRS